VIALAFGEAGVELEERVCDTGQWVWGWHRDDDTRFPCYLERGQAIEYMADRLRRGAIFR
jgi:hypothetical protein